MAGRRPGDNAHDMLQAFLDVLITSLDTGLQPFDAATIAALTGIKSRVSAIYRS